VEWELLLHLDGLSVQPRVKFAGYYSVRIKPINSGTMHFAAIVSLLRAKLMSLYRESSFPTVYLSQRRALLS
jgi:hypothetical protein